MRNGDLDPLGTPTSPESPISAKGPAELAPVSPQNRRSRPANDSLNRGGSATILIAVLAAEWVIFGIWALAPVISDWHRYVQPLVWIPDWLWLIGLLPLALVGIIGAVVLASRARLVWLLGRERERLRIAMDLHDELGSGLGSIRLLATLLGRERLDDATRVELAERIRGTTRELHGSVSELVGSLRPGGTTPAALVERLHRRAAIEGVAAGHQAEGRTRP